MASIHLDLLTQKQNSLPFSKRYPYIAIGILLGLGLFYLFRSWSFDTFSEATYSIGQDTRWLELHLMGKERHLSAFNQELLVAIAKQEHFYVSLSTIVDPIAELEQGKVQGILTTLQPNYLNETHLIFSEPYFLTGPVLIISSISPLEGANEKGKKIVGIQRQSLKPLSLEQDPSIQIKLYDDILPALKDLSKRRIDGAIFPALLAYTYTQTFYKHELKVATLPLTDEGIRLATLKNHRGEGLIKKFNEGLENLKQNGIYNEMLKRWGFINTEQIE